MMTKYPNFIFFLIFFCLIGTGFFYFSDIWKGSEIQVQTAPNLKLLNSHSSPQAGEKWAVSFETKGTADLTITPTDPNSIGDLDFVSLACEGKEKIEEGPLQILEGDVIFYPNWQCDGKGELTHLVNIARKHNLKFQFEDKMAYAYNNPDSVTDTFTDESKIATSTNITVSGGQVYSGICKDNGTACSGAGECCSNYCIDGVCCDGTCSGSTCQTCGQYSSNGIGYCGYVNDSGQDPDNECATTTPPAADSCKSANCSGTDYSCGYLAAGEQSQPVCKRCNGSSYDPVNVTDDTGDSEGSNLCDASSGDCYRCSSGSCTYQTAAQDLFNECPGALGTCAATTCSGSVYSCGYLSGQQACATCTYCTGASYSCTNVAADSDPYGACTGNCDECDGSGACRGDNTRCSNNDSSCYCSGSGTAYNCQACVTCKTCSSYSCTNRAIDTQPTGCTGCNYCNGSGSCLSCAYGSGSLQGFCLGTQAPALLCKPSRNGQAGYGASGCDAWTKLSGGTSIDKCTMHTCTCQ